VVEEKYSYVATFDEIKENEFNLNIPRYVDTFEEEIEIDVTAVQKEIDQLNKQLAQTETEINKYIKDL
jgi:type I restriction enzyme M protein